MMKKMLFVNACPRKEASRTLKLASSFLDHFRTEDWEIIEQDLTEMHLQSVDMQTLEMKEALCDAQAWNDSFFRYALQFQQADMVVIAAPYWDLSFPSILKVWVENMYVRNLTFHYVNDQCVGMCKGTEAVYVTTAGSPIRDNDWGALYMKAVLQALGIASFTSIRAEGLDLDGNDAQALMQEAMANAASVAQTLLTK